MKGTGGSYLSIPGLVATGDLSSYQYCVVKMASTADAVKVGSAATDAVIGVLMNDPTSGQPAEVAYSGVVKVKCEASTTVGSNLTCSSTGRAKSTTSAGNICIGQALDAGSTAGMLISVLLSHFEDGN